jgi:aminomethyltransferase
VSDPAEVQPILKLPLDALHRRLGARMAPFAGYDMPLHYSSGIIAEHLHTRAKAGLFDVSHMGQAIVSGLGAAQALEALTPADLISLPPERTRYTQFLDDGGGVLDDLMATRLPGRDESFFLVVNAATKERDFALLKARTPRQKLHVLANRALLALQGPGASSALSQIVPGVQELAFMSWRAFDFDGASVWVSRSGYTGEDGFEVSLPIEIVEKFALRLLEHPDVAPIGLGARDSLRLEAGLCLYGHDLDETTDPVEAGLAWSIAKRRRERGGFPGFARIQAALHDGPARRRVGLIPQTKTPVREGAELFANGRKVGRITSGGFSPSLSKPIAMGYVESGIAQLGAELGANVRGRDIEMRVAALPFVPHRYVRNLDEKDRL